MAAGYGRKVFMITAITAIILGLTGYASGIAECEKPADVVFVLDTSNSIWLPDFKKQLRFVRNLINEFAVGKDNMRVGVVAFSDQPRLQFHLNRFYRKKDVKQAVGRMRQNGGIYTYTNEAIKYMRTRAFLPENGARKNVTKIGIVITDGRSYDKNFTATEAKLAQEKGIHMFAIGVGSRVDRSELDMIASYPPDYYSFMVQNYDGLNRIKELLAIKTCTVTHPPTTTPTTTPVPTRPTVRFETTKHFFVDDKLNLPPEEFVGRSSETIGPPEIEVPGKDIADEFTGDVLVGKPGEETYGVINPGLYGQNGSEIGLPGGIPGLGDQYGQENPKEQANNNNKDNNGNNGNTAINGNINGEDRNKYGNGKDKNGGIGPGGFQTGDPLLRRGHNSKGPNNGVESSSGTDNGPGTDNGENHQRRHHNGQGEGNGDNRENVNQRHGGGPNGYHPDRNDNNGRGDNPYGGTDSEDPRRLTDGRNDNYGNGVNRPGEGTGDHNDRQEPYGIRGPGTGLYTDRNSNQPWWAVRRDPNRHGQGGWDRNNPSGNGNYNPNDPTNYGDQRRRWPFQTGDNRNEPSPGTYDPRYDPNRRPDLPNGFRRNCPTCPLIRQEQGPRTKNIDESEKRTTQPYFQYEKLLCPTCTQNRVQQNEPTQNRDHVRCPTCTTDKPVQEDPRDGRNTDNRRGTLIGRICPTCQTQRETSVICPTCTNNLEHNNRQDRNRRPHHNTESAEVRDRDHQVPNYGGHNTPNASPFALNYTGPGCAPHYPTDLVFVVDSRNGGDELQRHLWNFVRDIVSRLNMNGQNFRIQFVHECLSMPDLGINAFTNKAQLLEELRTIVENPRPVASLFRSMSGKIASIQEPFKERRKVGIYITDDKAQDLSETLVASKEAKEQFGVDIYTVGVGEKIEPDELRRVASRNDRHHVYMMTDHERLPLAARHLSRQLCTRNILQKILQR